MPIVKGKVKNNICAKKEKEAPWSVQVQRTRRISRVEAAKSGNDWPKQSRAYTSKAVTTKDPEKLKHPQQEEKVKVITLPNFKLFPEL